MIVTDNPDLKQRIADHLRGFGEWKARNIELCLNPPKMEKIKGMEHLFYNGIEVKTGSQDKKGFLIELENGKYVVTSY